MQQRFRLSWSVRLLLAPVLAAASLGAWLTVNARPAAADIGQQIASAQARLTLLENAAEIAAERYNGARVTLAGADRAAATAQQRQARARDLVAGLQRQVGEFAAQAYKSGGVSYLAALVGARSPDQLLDRFSDLQVIGANQQDALRSLKVAQLHEQEAALSAQAAVSDARRVLSQLSAAKAAVERNAAAAQQLLTELRAKQAELVHLAQIAAARAAAIQRAAALRAVQQARARAAALAQQQQATAVAAAAFAEQPVSPAPVPPAPVPAGGGAALDAAQVAVRVAEAQLGKPYVWGAAGPDTFDCSGLTMYAYAAAGIALPHFTGAQWNVGRHVALSALLPGDLVFYYSDLHHMGMYVGNGQVIEAPHTGDVVKFAPIAAGPYVGAVRVVG